MELLEKIKQFWIEELKKYSKSFFYGSYEGSKLGEYANWEVELKGKKSLKEIHDYSYRVASKIWNKSVWLGKVAPGSFTFNNWETFLLWEEKFSLTKKEKVESYYRIIMEGIDDYEKQLTQIQTDRDNFKSQLDNHKCSGSCSHTDYDSLKSQKDSLTTLKEGIEKQLKEKQDQILNHRCDTPNNAELNQTKEELKQANKEITSLKEQLGNKPNSPNDKEEEKEEQENNNDLTSEQLKEKLKSKQEEIKSLLTQLNQQKSQVNHHGSYSWGTLFVVGVVCLLSGSLIMFIIKKKKNY